MRGGTRLPLLGACVMLAACATSTPRPAPLPVPVVEAPPVSVPDEPVASPAETVAAEALGLAGVRYRYGGASPDTGFDCSGLVWYVYERNGVSLPRMSTHMAAELPEVERESRQVGDLLFFNTRGDRWSHVAIYIGNDRFVHAPSARTGRVLVSSLERPYWRRRLTGVRRPLSAAGT